MQHSWISRCWTVNRPLGHSYRTSDHSSSNKLATSPKPHLYSMESTGQTWLPSRLPPLRSLGDRRFVLVHLPHDQRLQPSHPLESAATRRRSSLSSYGRETPVGWSERENHLRDDRDWTAVPHDSAYEGQPRCLLISESLPRITARANGAFGRRLVRVCLR